MSLRQSGVTVNYSVSDADVQYAQTLIQIAKTPFSLRGEGTLQNRELNRVSRIHV